ncbi:MAG TPA: Mpo1-like protein [Burkholderiales bacterium]|nr:Mpo1-like protein [Burkholderiales bacterium]HSA69761.1 Mpo1-like protein [Burkholderiales bacterium]
MKSIEDQMSFYAAYHQDARNKATHFIGVPAIMLSLFIPLAWIRLEVGGFVLTAAMLFAAVVLVYYFVLDVPLGLAMLVVTAILLWIAGGIASLGAAAGWTWFAILFVGGWILQLVGHVFEGRKPALADNLFQIFVAPMFLAAEVFFALGYKRALQRRVNEKAQLSRAQSAESSISLERTSSRSGASGSRSA